MCAPHRRNLKIEPARVVNSESYRDQYGIDKFLINRFTRGGVFA